MASNIRTCNTCKTPKSLDASTFKVQRDGFSKTCLECLDKKKKTYATKKSGNKENQAEEEDEEAEPEIDDTADFVDMSAVNLDAFLASLAACEQVRSIVAHVDISSIQSSSMRETADRVAKAIWECLKYRFQCV
jgi:hypothetical protein